MLMMKAVVMEVATMADPTVADMEAETMVAIEADMVEAMVLVVGMEVQDVVTGKLIYCE